MTDLDQLEEEINQTNESAVLQRALVKAVLALARRIDYVIAKTLPSTTPVKAATPKSDPFEDEKPSESSKA